MNIAVIVDHSDENKRRCCFWNEQLDCCQDVKYKLVSLLKLMAKREFFNIYKFDIIIFNWCVLDGAVMYESDRVQNVVKFYDQHFYRFVKQKGGIIIFENQPKRWYPEQSAYDTLLKGQLKVLKESVPSSKEVVRINKKHKKHPLVNELQETIKSEYNHPVGYPWFPPKSTSKYSLDRLNPKKMYSGAFKWWKSSWLPLLYTEDMKYPVFLAKVDGEGIWIASTMFIASSNNKEFLNKLVNITERERQKIQRYHKQQNSKRKVKVVLITSVLIIFGVGFFIALKTNIIMIPIPHSNTFPISFLMSTMASVILWLVGKMLKLIYRWSRKKTHNT